MPFASLLRSTFCSDFLAPAHGRAGGGHSPFLQGKGWGMGGLLSLPAAVAVRRSVGPPY